jgi:hypothetical protein
MIIIIIIIVIIVIIVIIIIKHDATVHFIVCLRSSIEIIPTAILEGVMIKEMMTMMIIIILFGQLGRYKMMILLYTSPCASAAPSRASPYAPPCRCHDRGDHNDNITNSMIQYVV